MCSQRGRSSWRWHQIGKPMALECNIKKNRSHRHATTATMTAAVCLLCVFAAGILPVPMLKQVVLCQLESWRSSTPWMKAGHFHTHFNLKQLRFQPSETWHDHNKQATNPKLHRDIHGACHVPPIGRDWTWQASDLLGQTG